MQGGRRGGPKAGGSLVLPSFTRHSAPLEVRCVPGTVLNETVRGLPTAGAVSPHLSQGHTRTHWSHGGGSRSYCPTASFPPVPKFPSCTNPELATDTESPSGKSQNRRQILLFWTLQEIRGSVVSRSREKGAFKTVCPPGVAGFSGVISRVKIPSSKPSS